MMHAYAKTYLPDAMDALGEMLDYAVHGRGFELSGFYERFLASPISDAFGNGHPKYLAGMSGIELADEVLGAPGAEYIPEPPGLEYWCGWAMAYLQWHTGWSFAYIQNHGLPISAVAEMYQPLHEADITKFVDIAIERIVSFSNAGESPVKRYRKALGITQQELAERCGITLRMVQAYEQRRQDLAKAEAATLINLSCVLCCRPEDLI